MRNTDRPVYFTTHKSNLGPLAATGVLHSPDARPPGLGYRDIGDLSILASRKRVMVPFRPPCALSSCVALTFNTKTPIGLNIATGYKGVERVANTDLVFLMTSIQALLDHRRHLAVADRLPTHHDAQITCGLGGLEDLAWHVIDTAQFSGQVYPASAELLAETHVPLQVFDAVLCWDQKDTVARIIEQSCTDWRPEVVRSTPSFFPGGA